jgi:hypothetical protein
VYLVVLPVLYCPAFVAIVVVAVAVAVAAAVVFVFVAALVRPPCSPYPPADEPEPFTVVPGGESGMQSHYSHAVCAAGDSLTMNVLAVDPFLILLSGTLHFPFLFVKIPCLFSCNE